MKNQCIWRADERDADKGCDVCGEKYDIGEIVCALPLLLQLLLQISRSVELDKAVESGSGFPYAPHSDSAHITCYKSRYDEAIKLVADMEKDMKVMNEFIKMLQKPQIPDRKYKLRE